MSYMGIGEIGKKDFEFLDYLFREYIPSYNEIWLFGTGVYAHAFTKYLKSCDVAVAGYVVSSVSVDQFEGKPVISINEFKRRKAQRGEEYKAALLLTISSSYLGEVYPYLMSLDEDVCFIKGAYLEYAREHCGNIQEIILSVPLTEFCTGILCYGCTSCIALVEGKPIYPFEQFCVDLSRVKNMIGSKITHINFTGGDVFLHPQLIEVVEYTRELFPYELISLSINGIMLAKQSEEFFSRLGRCNVKLDWTLYPVKYPDLEETMKIITRIGGITLSINGDAGGEDKNSWKLPYSFEKQEKYDWLLCRHHKCGNNVLTMYKNTLGVCHPHRAMRHLEHRFGSQFTKKFQDAVDQFNNGIPKIDEITDKEEILEYMQRRPILCDYCALRKRENMGKWLRSKGAFEEWFD